MDLTCRFGLEYRPIREADRDPIAEIHVRNCADCQEQTFLLS